MKDAKKNTLVIIAGEDSGDIYGGMLAKDILALNPDINIVGIGGKRMREAGVELICDVKDTAVVGAVEIMDKLFFLYRIYRQVVSIFKSGSVAGVVLIDYPEFNLPLARHAFNNNVPVFYYISPQIWAWRKGRVRKIRKYIKRMMVILPFEKGFYEGEGVEVDFVGHPMVDIVKPTADPESLKRELDIVGASPIVSILPGSRKKEVRALLPELVKVVRELKGRYPEAKFLIPLSPSIDELFVAQFFSGEDSHHIKILKGRNYDVMSLADLLITKSGTSTLEAAIIGVPMVIIYKTSFFSMLLAKLLVQVSFAGLPNLLAGKEIVPELIQGNMRSNLIIKEAISILDDPRRRDVMRHELGQVRDALGGGGASLRAAKIVVHGLSH